MTTDVRYRYVLWFSIALAALITSVSLSGLLVTDFYHRETGNWQVQCLGQDLVDLCLVTPVLLISMFLAYSGRKIWLLIWGGVLIYILYTFLIYSFGVHFNLLFPVYCITLGVAFYASLCFISDQTRSFVLPTQINHQLRRIVGAYFVALAVMFYVLWLGEIFPSILDDAIPASVVMVGLPTNPVHVIDLSVFLPGLGISGVLLLKQQPIGYLLAPMLLTFFVLMDITIAALMLMMQKRGMESNMGLTMGMGALAVMSLLLLILYLRQYKHTTTQTS